MAKLEGVYTFGVDIDMGGEAIATDKVLGLLLGLSGVILEVLAVRSEGDLALIDLGVFSVGTHLAPASDAPLGVCEPLDLSLPDDLARVGVLSCKEEGDEVPAEEAEEEVTLLETGFGGGA